MIPHCTHVFGLGERTTSYTLAQGKYVIYSKAETQTTDKADTATETAPAAFG